jgi:hypothetical protein
MGGARLRQHPGPDSADVRYAFMQDTEEGVGNVELVVRLRTMVSQPRVGLPVVCPSDTHAGLAAGASRGSYGSCLED